MSFWVSKILRARFPRNVRIHTNYPKEAHLKTIAEFIFEMDRSAIVSRKKSDTLIFGKQVIRVAYDSNHKVSEVSYKTDKGYIHFKDASVNDILAWKKLPCIGYVRQDALCILVRRSHPNHYLEPLFYRGP